MDFFIRRIFILFLGTVVALELKPCFLEFREDCLLVFTFL